MSRETAMTDGVLEKSITAMLEQERASHRRMVGLVLAAYGEAIERGDRMTAGVLDSLASQLEHCA